MSHKLFFGAGLLILLLSCCMKASLTRSNSISRLADTSCGTTTLKSYIVFGDISKHNAWPFQVAINIKNPVNGKVYLCGGTIINKHWILTAAHCINTERRAKYRVFVGIHMLPNVNARGGLEVDHVIPHENYRSVKAIYGKAAPDIALFHLGRPLRYTDAIRPACMPSRKVTLNEQCVAVGWGRTENGTLSDIMREATMTIGSNSRCVSMLGRKLTEEHICLIHNERGSGTCDGDSGGGLYCYRDNVWEVAGLTNFGALKCSIKDAPEVHANVFHLTDWIHNEIYKYESRPIMGGR